MLADVDEIAFYLLEHLRGLTAGDCMLLTLHRSEGRVRRHHIGNAAHWSLHINVHMIGEEQSCLYSNLHVALRSFLGERNLLMHGFDRLKTRFASQGSY